MKKILTVLFSCVLIAAIVFLSSVTAFANTAAYSWYCPRTKDHTVPELDAQMEFIEKYDGYYVDRNTNGEKVIYLTFDAGYENGNIEKILDVMKSENVKGAFFILSNLIIKDPELVLRMKEEGHLICNHTSKHPDVTNFENVDAFKAELQKLEVLYFELTGDAMPKYFRPPEGKFSEKSMSFAKELGYKTIFWSFAYADWDNANQMSHDKAKEKIMSNIHNGEIMLLHPTSKTNAEILSDVIRELKAQGYRFGTLDELTKK